MPIDLPDLDDIDYDDLVQGALAALPALYPGWTDYNPSDPGVALIELLAWLTDMVVYRTNRIPPANYEVFLGLLTGEWRNAIPKEDLPAAIDEALLSLQRIYRAVTTGDYVQLTRDTFPGTDGARGQPSIERVECLGERNLAPGADPTAPAPGHVSLVVAPDAGEDLPWSAPSADLAGALAAFFEPRRLVTTKLHVVGPGYVEVSIQATLYLASDADSGAVIPAATSALAAYYHPWTGGADGKGWPFGRAVYVSEIASILSRVSGVAFVDTIVLSTAEADEDRWVDGAGEPTSDPAAVAAVELEPHELVKFLEENVTFTVKVLYGTMGQPSTKWQEPTS